jgi:hypothetical protein
VRRKSLSRITATLLLVTTAVAGCGGTALVGTTLIPPTTTTTATPGQSNATSDEYASARYCQRLNDGEWVTNVSAFSTTPCVPEPSYATGNEQADGYQAIPRCFTCTLSDWERAEKRAAVGNGSQPQVIDSDAAGADSPSSDGAPVAGESYFEMCAQNVNNGVCSCVANRIEQQVPQYQLAALTADDPRVQDAIETCEPSKTRGSGDR